MRGLLALICFIPTLLVAADRPAVPAPQALPDDQIFALVIIDDLPALVTKIDALVARFSPQAPAGGALTQSLERVFGAEGVAAIGQGPALIAIGPGGMAPALAFVIPSANPDLLAQAFAGHRRIQAVAAGDAVVIAPQAVGLPLGQGLAPLRAGLAVADPQVDARILVAPSRIHRAYEPMITPGIGMLKANLAKGPESAVMLPVLLGQIAVGRNLLDQLDEIAVDLRLDDQAISGTMTVVAASGSALAAAQVAPVVAWPDDLCRRMGDGPAWLKGAGRVNGPAMCDFMADLAASLKDVPEVAPYLDDTVLDTLWAWADLWDGTFAHRLHGTEAMPMIMENGIGVTDPERYLELTRTLWQAMFDAGPIADLYAQMGIAATMQEGSRTSGDLPVHRFAYTLDETKLDPLQAEQMKLSLRDLELALPPGCMVMAQVPADLDRLVAGGVAPMSFAATTVIGPGRDLVMDVDLIGCAKDYARFLPGPMFQPLREGFAPLPSGEPMVLAWTADQGRGLTEWRLPLKPLIDLVAAGRSAFAAPPPENLQEF